MMFNYLVTLLKAASNERNPWLSIMHPNGQKCTRISA